MDCGQRVGKGTITYPCTVPRTQERTDPEFGGYHQGPCAAVENPASVASRQRWESGAPARAQLAAHQSRPMTFADANPVHQPTPVPGTGMQPAEHRQTYRPVVGGFGEQPVAEAPCEHPFGAIYEGRDGATICGQCGERLKEPEVVQSEGTLRSFVDEHQAPPEVLAARAEEGAAAIRAMAEQPVQPATFAPAIEGAEPFPGLPAAPPLSVPRLGITPGRFPDGTEVQYQLEGHVYRGRIVPHQEGWGIPDGSYPVERDDDGSVWSVAPEAITAVYEKASDTISIARDAQTGDPIGFHKAEPTKQRPGDQALPVQGNPRRAVQDIIIEAMEESKRVGTERYGQPLKPMNGRDTLLDAKEEARDLYVYLTALDMERAEVLGRFERAYSALFDALSDEVRFDLDAVLAWLRGAPET